MTGHYGFDDDPRIAAVRRLVAAEQELEAARDAVAALLGTTAGAPLTARAVTSGSDGRTRRATAVRSIVKTAGVDRATAYRRISRILDHLELGEASTQQIRLYAGYPVAVVRETLAALEDAELITCRDLGARGRSWRLQTDDDDDRDRGSVAPPQGMATTCPACERVPDTGAVCECTR